MALTALPFTITRPLRHSSAASVRVLKIRTAQSHLSILISFPMSINRKYFCKIRKFKQSNLLFGSVIKFLKYRGQRLLILATLFFKWLKMGKRGSGKKTLIWICTFVLVLILYFFGRIILLNEAVKIISEKLKNRYQLDFTVEKTEFKGFRSLLVEKTLIENEKNDTVFYADSLFFQLRFWPLFAGHMMFGKFSVSNLKADIDGVLIDEIFHYHKTNIDSTNFERSINIAKRIDGIFKTLFSLVPRYVELRNITIKYHRVNLKFSIHSPELSLENDNLYGSFETDDNKGKSKINISGTIDRSNENFNFKLNSSEKQAITVPYINQKWGATIKFDTLTISLKKISSSWENVKFKGYVAVANLNIQHKKISPMPVVAKSGKLDFIFNGGEKFIELDSSSVITINKFSFKPYFCISKTLIKK